MIGLFSQGLYSIYVIKVFNLYERLSNFILMHTLRTISSLLELRNALEVIGGKLITIGQFVTEAILDELYMIKLFEAVD